MAITPHTIAGVVEAHHDRMLAAEEAQDDRRAEYMSLLDSEIARIPAEDLWFALDMAGLDRKGFGLEVMSAIANGDMRGLYRFIRPRAEKLAAENLAKRGIRA